MFTYYIHDGPSALRFKLIGALAGPACAEVEQCWLTALSTVEDRAFVVDIKELTGADDAGRDLLARWRSSGAQFLTKPAPERRVPRWLPSLRFAMASSLAVLAMLLPGRVWAVDSAPTPGSVLERYNAALARRDQPEHVAVAVDIDASLPKLAKQGHLQAIRRLVPFGKPEYEVIQTEGDRMVRQQVIARYLSAEAEAKATPPSAVAISSANYKFRFVGPIGAGPNLAYVYQIKPRKKRQGLIQGELWIDAATGIAVHQAGHLVKRPSLFLRRVNLVQDTDLRDGRPCVRITRLDVETLLVGRAELTIRERPAEPVVIVRNAGPDFAE